MLVITANGWREADDYPLSLVRDRQRGVPVILVINKIDRLKDMRLLLPLIEASRHKFEFAEIVPVSALKGTNLEALERALIRYLPEQPPLYPPERQTDKGARFLAAELVREQIFRLYGQEVPYACAVIVDTFREENGRLYIAMTIWVEREGQKPILIGKGGERLKLVGMRARRELEQILGTKVHLELYVKHRPGWSDSESALRALGYTEEY
jgi:GTP-binding protein Era